MEECVRIIALIEYLDVAIQFKIIFSSIGFIIFLVGCFIALKIEQIAGFYKCKVCDHKYKPAYGKILIAQHICRTRYMKCPKCGKRSWNKKVLK